jgi:vitamin B12 transporter
MSLSMLCRAGLRRTALLASTAIGAILAQIAPPAAIAQTGPAPQELTPVVVSPPPPRRSVAPAPQAVAPVVVTTPTTVPTPADQVANSITVITAADMERDQQRTVPDALATVPGLNIVQTGGPGGQTSVFMRGTNSNHVKVLIDGIDVTDPSNPNRSFDFGQLLTSDLERIEVLRGPQSGLYGSDAIGGVIAFTTKKGEGPPKATVSLEGGSFDTFNQTASLSGGTDRFDYAFNVAHFRAGSTPVTPLELLPPGRKRINDSYDNLTTSSRLGATLSDNVAVNWVGRYTESDLRFTGDDFSTFPSTPAAQQSEQRVHQFFTRGEAVVSAFDGRLKNYFGIALTDHWNWNVSPGAVPTVNKGDRVKEDYRGVLAILPGQTLVFGADHEIERLRTDTTTAQNGNQGGYVELQSDFHKRIFLVANARIDDNDAFGQHFTYRVAPAVILPVTDTKLKASVGTGFKAPTLSELFVSFPAFRFFANPNLKPEESFGYDVGFEQPLFQDRVRFGATYFHNDINNLITTQFNADFSSSYVNVNKAKTQGAETFVAVAATPQVKLRGDYTYTWAIDAITGLELLRRPIHKASATAIWAPIETLQLSATVLHVGDWIDGNRDFSVPRLAQPGYTIVNLAANYTVNENTKMFARVDNLFDLRYQDPSGFLRPGLGVFGGIRLATR